MKKQFCFSEVEYGAKRKLARRDLFLAKMKAVVPFGKRVTVVEPHDPTSG